MRPTGALGRVLSALALGLAMSVPATALDLAPMWDFQDPAASEARFRSALADARGDDALVLRTQIARTYSLRQRFDEAHAELDAIGPLLATAGPEPQVRAMLERGRTLRSAGDAAGSRTYFEQALAIAEPAGLGALEGDALHMLALVEPTPEAQVAANRRLAERARAAADPGMRRWLGPTLNNLGVTLNELGRHDEALAVLQEAVPVFEQGGRAPEIRIARWMVAHTLRLLGRLDQALAQQEALERELDAAAEPDPFVYEELSLLHAARGDAARAAHYRQLQQAAAGKS